MQQIYYIRNVVQMQLISYTHNVGRWRHWVILKYAGTMAPILLVVGEAKAELAQALVPCKTGAMCK